MRIGFFLIDRFSMMSVVASIEPLRSANRHLGRRVYSWTQISLDGSPVSASNGMSISVDASLQDCPPLDFLFVCAGLDVDPPARPRIHAALHRVRRQGTRLGALSTGTFILARAGFVEDRRCTVHWENLAAFRDEFPQIAVENSLYTIDRDLYTCSGGLAGTDMFLHVIAGEHGASVARAVGNQFQIDRIRDATEEQRHGSLERLATLPQPLQDAIHTMQANIENPLGVDELAELTGIHTRSLQRYFRSCLKCSPIKYYQRIRLENARELLFNTSLPIIDIAQMTGFSSHSQFTTCFRKHFGEAPNAVRLRSRGVEMPPLAAHAV